MALVADELKAKRAEISGQIEDMRRRIADLERQQASLDVVIRIYEPEYASEAAPPRGRAPRATSSDGLSELFQGFDRRGFALRTLREASGPMTTADVARAFVRNRGLADDDRRIGKIGNRFSQVLDQLAKAKRVRKAGMLDGHRHLWEVAA